MRLQRFNAYFRTMLRVYIYLAIAQCGLTSVWSSVAGSGINTVYEWRQFQYAYPSNTEKQKDIQSGLYKPSAPLPIDVDVYYDSKGPMVFVSTPKFSPGVPATLGYVLNQKYKGDPLVQPFPTWEWHRHNKSSPQQCPKRLISVLRMKIDRCGLLWILDSGSDNDVIVCPPKIVTFDLKQWPRVKYPQLVYEYPKDVYNANGSLFATIDIDSLGRDCSRTRYAYAADITKFRLVVTDLYRRFSWKVESPSMKAQENLTNINIMGKHIRLDDGIVGLSIYPRSANQHYKHLYYSPLAGRTESKIKLAYLNKGSDPPPIYTYATPRSSESIAMDISRNGIAFFGLTSEVSINCWNVESKDYGNYIHKVYKNPVTMQFASGVKVLTNPHNAASYKEELWILTNRMQMFGSYNFSEVNFRVSMGNVARLVQNSRCRYPNL